MWFEEIFEEYNSLILLYNFELTPSQAFCTYSKKFYHYQFYYWHTFSSFKQVGWGKRLSNQISKRPQQKVAFSSVYDHRVALRLLPSVYVAHDCFDWRPLQW